MIVNEVEREAMVQKVPVELAKDELKEIEQQIVNFYLKIAKRYQLNLKEHKVFAYLKLYDSLTQKQLKKLTNFSAGFISITLKSFLQSSIVTRNFIPKTHTNVYTISDKHMFTLLPPRSQFYRNLEEHEQFVIRLQGRLEKLKEKYPLESTFLIRRLNGMRNYFETEKMVETIMKKPTFLEENVSGLLAVNEFIEYPKEIAKLESSLVDRFVRLSMFVKDDPIINKILSYLITREKISQEKLLILTGYSRSTISRNLKGYGEQDYITITKKVYLKPRIYYMKSIGVYLNEVILNNRKFVLSWRPKFIDLLSQLKTISHFKKNRELNLLFQRKIKDIISNIDLVKERTHLQEKAQQELKDFVKQNN